MHPEMTMAIARAQTVERTRAAETARRGRRPPDHVPGGLRVGLGRALVGLGTRLAPPAETPVRVRGRQAMSVVR
jgi:hypothetical protein